MAVSRPVAIAVDRRCGGRRAASSSGSSRLVVRPRAVGGSDAGRPRGPRQLVRRSGNSQSATVPLSRRDRCSTPPSLTPMLLPSWMDPDQLIKSFGPYALWGVAFIVFAECGLFAILPGDSLLFTVGLLDRGRGYSAPRWRSSASC